MAIATNPEKAEQMKLLGVSQIMLDEGQALVSEWYQRRLVLDEAKAKLEMASKAKQEARELAQLEMRGLVMLCRRQFFRDERILRLLGLNTKRKTVPITGDNHSQEGGMVGEEGAADQHGSFPELPPDELTMKVAVDRSRAEDFLVEFWRQFLECIAILPAETRDIIGRFGYDEEHLARLRETVDAFAATIPEQDQAMEERKERNRLFSLTDRNLQTWIVTMRSILGARTRLLKNQLGEEVLAVVNL